jgi:enolase
LVWCNMEPSKTLEFNGMGVLEAVSNINDCIVPAMSGAMSGMLTDNQAMIDRKLIKVKEEESKMRPFKFSIHGGLRWR